MARYIIIKTPSEVLSQTMDFNPDLPSGNTVDTVAGSAVDSSGASASVVTPVPSDSNNIASFTLSGGTAGETYQVKIAATLTPSTFVIEHFIEMRVRTFPYEQ